MQIGGDYPKPVMVNGFACHNCAEVSAAKRGLDPAELSPGATTAPEPFGDAVSFGGELAGRSVPAAGQKEPRLLDRLA